MSREGDDGLMDALEPQIATGVRWPMTATDDDGCDALVLAREAARLAAEVAILWDMIC